MSQIELWRRMALVTSILGALGLGACSSNSCPAPFVTCGSSCIDTRYDPTNCGSCGTACASGQLCSSGKCVAVGAGASSGSTSTGGTTGSASTGGSTGGTSTGGSTGTASTGGTTSGGSTGGLPSCLGDGGFDCSKIGQYCNPTSGVCVDCFSSDDCADSVKGMVCDPSTDSCVQCLTAADCPYTSPGCSNEFCGSCSVSGDCPANNSCVDGSCLCSDNTGCGGVAPECNAPDGGQGSCGCTDSSLCPATDYCSATGFTLNGTCVPPCTSDAGSCLLQGPTPFCDADSGMCQACYADQQCVDAGLGQFCVANVGCAACLQDSDCSNAAQPYCNFGSCVQCANPSQCSSNAPGCNFLSNICGSCSTATDCPTGMGCLIPSCAPLCGTGPVPDGGCAACVFDYECGDGGYCDRDAGGLCE